MTYHFWTSGSLGFSYWIYQQILMGWTCSKSLRSSCLGWLPVSRIRRNWWWLKTWFWSPNFLTCPILLLVNFYSFQEWNHGYEGVISNTSLKFRNNHWPQFQKVISEVLPAVPQTADSLHRLKWWLLGNAQPVTKFIFHCKPSCKLQNMPLHTYMHVRTCTHAMTFW